MNSTLGSVVPLAMFFFGFANKVFFSIFLVAMGLLLLWGISTITPIKRHIRQKGYRRNLVSGPFWTKVRQICIGFFFANYYKTSSCIETYIYSQVRLKLKSQQKSMFLQKKKRNLSLLAKAENGRGGWGEQGRLYFLQTNFVSSYVLSR